MANKLKTYRFFGVLRGPYPIDLNGMTVNAYSKKQAKFKLAFRIREANSSITIPPAELMKIINRSKLTIRRD